MKGLLQLIRPNNFIFWIVVAIGFKFLQTFLLAPTIKTNGDNFYAALGDTPFYVDATKGLINEGEYYYKYHDIFFGPVRKISLDNDPPEANTKIYTYRMPGYPILLYPFMKLFEADKALNIVAVLQLVFAAISVYFLAYLIYLLTDNKWTFYATFFLYLLSFYTAKWSTYIMTESYSISMLITLFLFCALVYKQRKIALVWYAIIGLGIALALFMRPFFIPLYGSVVLLFLFMTYKRQMSIAALLLFISPAVLGEATWVIRNKMVTGKAVLLEDTINYFDMGNQTLKEWTGFVLAIGGNKLYWEGNSHGRWLLPQWYFAMEGAQRPTDEIWPDWIREDPSTFAQINQIRDRFASTLDTTINLETRLQMEQQNIREIAQLKEMVKHEKPFLFYVGSRYKIFMQFINQITDVSYKSLRFPVNLVYSMIGPAINVLVMYCGSIALIGFLLLYNRKLPQVNPVVLAVYFVPLFLIFFIQIIIGAAENRHLAYTYPFLLFGLVYLTWAVRQKHKIAGYALTGLLALVVCSAAVYHLLYYVKW